GRGGVRSHGPVCRPASAASALARAGAAVRDPGTAAGGRAVSRERAIYLDSSAIVKLAVAEPESAALRRHLRRRRPLVSSALARTEVLRALLPAGSDAVAAGRAVLASLELLRVNDRVLEAAGALQPADLR